jgi:ethanolamine utilization microcompartment shell protein EutL
MADAIKRLKAQKGANKAQKTKEEKNKISRIAERQAQKVHKTCGKLLTIMVLLPTEILTVPVNAVLREEIFLKNGKAQ